ncbi:MAG: integrase family protein [Syntrophales bacterium]|jgi:integrase|nr:integrase family protein [Syntrophales bacterium]
MKRIRLTLERIKALECPANKQQSFTWDTDATRLAVRITAAGIKSFIFEGKLNRITIRRTIGKCSDWTIDDARKEARRLQGLLDKGIDPREVKKKQEKARAAKKAADEAAKNEAEASKVYTLKALMEEYATFCESKGKKIYAGAVRSATKCHLTDADPALASTPAKDITPRQAAALVRRVMEAGKERTAGSFRSYLAAAYNCAMKAPVSAALPSSFISFNIESNPVTVVPTIPVKARNRTLSRDELKVYIQGLGDGLTDQALKIALYCGGQRMAQVLRLEVRDWDPQTKVLRLMDPKGKRTEPREHLLPLAPIAASIVADLIERAKAAQTTFLFPSATKMTPIHISMPGPRIREIINALNEAAKKEGKDTIIENFDIRDIRRTCETMLAGLGISRDIRAQLLSHGISGVQAVHYDRHEYIKEKRAALVKWERYLKGVINDEAEKKVIPFEKVAKAVRIGN